MARRGEAWQVRPGMARYGTARHGLAGMVGQPAAFVSGLGAAGVARFVMAGQVEVG